MRALRERMERIPHRLHRSHRGRDRSTAAPRFYCGFVLDLPANGLTGRWRERGRMGAARALGRPQNGGRIISTHLRWPCSRDTARRLRGARRCSAPGAWARSIAPAIHGWGATSRSRCCPPIASPTRAAAAASSRRRRRPRRSIIRTSSRFTRSRRPTATISS